METSHQRLERQKGEAQALAEGHAADAAKLRDALRLVHKNGHEYRPVPCVTCRAVSNLTGEPFGCEAFKESSNQEECRDGS